MSVNGVDPRLITEWLKLEFTKLESTDRSGDFAAMLELLTSQTGKSGKDGTTAYGLDALAAGSTLFPVSAVPASGSGSGEADAPEELEAIIAQASAKHGVNPDLVKAVIRTESGYDPNAVSPAGAKGLMQLMDATAESLGVADAFDPKQNIDGGVRFLSYLLTKYKGNVGVALAAYNAGPGRVDRLGIKTDADLAMVWERLPAETQAYIGRVLGKQA